MLHAVKYPNFVRNLFKKLLITLTAVQNVLLFFANFVNVSKEQIANLKLCDTRWLSRYLCIERLLESWDTIQYFLNEIVITEKTKSGEYLLSIMSNVDTKAYFLFLKYILNFFNAFNAFFQALETRIHLLQPKSLNFLFKICQHFLKDEHLKPFSMNIIFSLKENQKILNEINLGSECEEYLNKIMMQGHKDVVTTV